MNNEQSSDKPKQILYNNNPFSLAFDAFSRAFKINQNPAIAVLVGGIVIYIANQVFGNLPDVFNYFAEKSPNEGQKIGFSIASLILSLGYIITSAIVNSLWLGFTAFVGLKNAKSESTTFGEGLRSSAKSFWKILATGILLGLIGFAFLLPAIVVGIVGAVLAVTDQKEIAVGTIIFAVVLAFVGLFFAFRFSIARTLTYYAMMDENLGIFESMNLSKNLTKNRLIEMMGMSFAGAIVPVISPVLVAFGLGAHYLQLKVYREYKADIPKTHILSWLPIMLIGFVGLIIVPIALFIMIAALRNS